MSIADQATVRWQQVPVSDRRALSICGVFLLLVFGYIGVLDPLVSRYDSVGRELAELRGRQSSNARKIALLPRREARLAQYRAQRNDLEQRFQPGVESVDQAVSRSIAEFTYYARLSDVDISSVRPQSEAAAGEYIELPFELEVSGDYNSLRKFIYYIDTSPSVLAVTRLQLKPATDSVVRADLQVTDVIRIAEADTDQQQTPLTNSNRLRLVIPDWPGFLPLWVAENEGYLDSDRYSIEIIDEHDKITLERLMLSGQVDAIGLTLADLLGYWVIGLPLKVVRPVSRAIGTEGIVVSNNSSISSVVELKGQRIAVDEQGLLPYVLHQALRESEVNSSDIVGVPREASQVARELRSGLLEAGVTREPWLSSLLADGHVRQIYGNQNSLPGVLDLLAVYSPVNNDKQAVVQFLINALYRAEVFMSQNADLTVQLLADRLATNTVVAEQLLIKVSMFDHDESMQFFESQEIAERLLNYQQYFNETDQPVPLITAADIIDSSYIEAVSKESGHDR